jgi:hypothetical protein
MAARKPRRLEYVPLAELAPALVNPKAHDDDLIGGSVGRFGFVEPFVEDERTQRLVAGHGRRDELHRRYEAGETPPDGIVVQDGVWLVPVVRGWSSASDDEAHAAGIALNRVGERGGWQPELASVLDLLDRTELALTGIGFDRLDVDEMLQSLSAPLSVDEASSKYGTPDPQTLWPWVRVQLPPATFDRYMALLDKLGDGSELDRFTLLLDAAEGALTT